MNGWWVLLFVACLAALAAYPGNMFNLAVWSMRRSLGLKKQHIKVGRHDIVYLEGGDGPDLVLLHGFGGNKDNWLRFAGKLTSFFHVVIPDLPGFGESSYFDDEQYDVNSQVDRMLDILLAMKLEEYHLAGNSMGGQISTALTLKRPGAVLSLILFGAAGMPESEVSETNRMLAAGINPLVVHSAADYERFVSFVCFKPPAVPGFITRGLARDAVSHLSTNEKIFEQFIAKWVDFRDTLSKIEAPALIVWGREDRVFHFSSVENWARGLKNSEAVIFDNCGHLPMLELPEESAREVRNFIASRGN